MVIVRLFDLNNPSTTPVAEFDFGPTDEQWAEWFATQLRAHVRGVAVDNPVRDGSHYNIRARTAHPRAISMLINTHRRTWEARGLFSSSRRMPVSA